jgi:hypothetical protein
MLSPPLSRPRNQLLAALSPADFRLLQPHLSSISLNLRANLEMPNRQIDDVYFLDAVSPRLLPFMTRMRWLKRV